MDQPSLLYTLAYWAQMPSFWLCIAIPGTITLHTAKLLQSHLIDGWPWLLPSSCLLAVASTQWHHTPTYSALLIPPWSSALLALWIFFRHLDSPHTPRLQWEQTPFCIQIAFSLTWLSTLCADLFHAHTDLFPSRHWAYLTSIGGAGPLDGLFIFPLFSSLLAFYSLTRTQLHKKNR